MTITLVSVVIAILIGGIEALGLLMNQMQLSGPFWTVISQLNGNFNNLGFIIIAIFIVAWAGSVVVYRYKDYDRLEVKKSTNS
jgi:high-affinity nickel-transport protein